MTAYEWMYIWFPAASATFYAFRLLRNSRLNDRPIVSSAGGWSVGLPLMYEMLPAPVLLLDGEARVRYANPCARQVFGLSAFAEQPVLFTLLFPFERRVEIAEAFACGLDLSKRVYKTEYTLTGKDGRMFPAKLDYAFWSSGKETLLLVTLRDMTVYAQAEQRRLEAII